MNKSITGLLQLKSFCSILERRPLARMFLSRSFFSKLFRSCSVPSNFVLSQRTIIPFSSVLGVLSLKTIPSPVLFLVKKIEGGVGGRQVARILPRGVQHGALILSFFFNNAWFVFTVVYGCFYYIVNAH